MAATMDHQQRHLGGVGFDHLPYPTSSHQFSGPSWPASTAAISNQVYPSALGPSTSRFEALVKQEVARNNNISLPYTSLSTSTSSIGAPSAYGPYGQQQDLLNLPPNFSNISRQTFEHGYSAAPVSSEDAYAAIPAPYLNTYESLSPQPQQQQQHSHTRRSSQESISSASQSQSSFGESLEGRGLGEMGQDLTTPRVDLTTPKNIYGQKSNRESADSYGFPQSHSSHSSISSASAYPSYYNSSLDNSSVSDYGSQSDSVEPTNSRTLPPPTGLMNASLTPAPPSSMMGQFNSKISSSSQKKHKCKICDKRFTRPSSLQTHMYSHTGEKPYACEAEGCGRHFSVVSNLRRHRKVHRCDQSPDKDSPEGSWVSETSSTNH